MRCALVGILLLFLSAAWTVGIMVSLPVWTGTPAAPTRTPYVVTLVPTPTMRPFLPHGSPVAVYPRRPCPLVECPKLDPLYGYHERETQ
jgi:hypothetical protein